MNYKNVVHELTNRIIGHVRNTKPTLARVPFIMHTYFNAAVIVIAIHVLLFATPMVSNCMVYFIKSAAFKTTFKTVFKRKRCMYIKPVIYPCHELRGKEVYTYREMMVF